MGMDVSGSGKIGADRPGRAPGLLAGDKVDSRLALMHDGVVDPDAHGAARAHVRPRWALGARAMLLWARHVIADTAAGAGHSKYAHGHQSCIQSREPATGSVEGRSPPALMRAPAAGLRP